MLNKKRTLPKFAKQIQKITRQNFKDLSKENRQTKNTENNNYVELTRF